jgi:hypothetical protein
MGMSVPESGPRNVFVYLLSLLTLYLSAIGVAVLIWGLADYWFPDPIQRYRSNGAVRTGISMVVVAFPVFMYVSAYIARKLRSGELPARSMLRRVMTFVTLFIIAVTAIVDLITILYNFLGGDLTARFAVKAFGILAITGLVFLYYLGELRSQKESDVGSRTEAVA